MKLRKALKVGRAKPGRHRKSTVQKAFQRFWKHDVRHFGIPGNWDCVMVQIAGYPNFGPQWDE